MRKSGVRDLEAAMRADPDDADVALVYADALASRGDPRGELIVLQHRAESATGRQLAKLETAIYAHLHAHSEVLLGPLAHADVLLAWRRGFVRRLALRAPVPVKPLLDHPSAGHLTELVLDPISSADAAEVVALPQIDQLARLELLLDDWLDCARVIDALAARHRPALTTLVFGSTAIDERADAGSLYAAWDDNPIVSIESLRALAAATPGLVELELRGEYLFAGLEHPRLRQLTLIGDAINGLPWDYLEGDVKLPSLERLEMTLLKDEYRYPPISPLTLDRKTTPALRELLLHNPSHHYNDGAQDTMFGYVAESAMLPRLDALTIAELHQVDDEPNLERYARRFRHLARFHIEALITDDESDETDEEFEARCRKALPKAELGDVE